MFRTVRRPERKYKKTKNIVFMKLLPETDFTNKLIFGIGSRLSLSKLAALSHAWVCQSIMRYKIIGLQMQI
jgi:hypothetical protein